MSNETNSGKARISIKEAMQRHHDHYTMKALTQPIGELDLPNMRAAIDRRLNGEVEPIERSGVFLILED